MTAALGGAVLVSAGAATWQTNAEAAGVARASHEAVRPASARTCNGPTSTHSGNVVLAADPVSAKAGWVLTQNALLRTTDGGTTWARVTPPDGARVDLSGALLAARNADQAWLACQSRRSVVVEYTADGGQTWVAGLVPAPHATNLYALLTGRPNPLLLKLSTAHAYLMTTPGAGSFQEPVVLYRATADGTMWRQVSLTGPSATSLPNVSDKNGLTVTAEAGTWLTGYAPGRGTYVYHSTDDGHTWHRVNLPLPPGYDVPGGAIDPFAPNFSGSDGVLPVMLEGRRLRVLIERTTDGGRSWRLGAVVPEPPLTPPALSFVGTRVGYLVGTKGLLVTYDSGVHWHVARGWLPETTTALSFINQRFGWAVAGSKLWATHDGGRSWLPLALTAVPPLQHRARPAPRRSRVDANYFTSATHGRVVPDPVPSAVVSRVKAALAEPTGWRVAGDRLLLRRANVALAVVTGVKVTAGTLHADVEQLYGKSHVDWRLSANPHGGSVTLILNPVWHTFIKGLLVGNLVRYKKGLAPLGTPVSMAEQWTPVGPTTEPAMIHHSRGSATVTFSTGARLYIAQERHLCGANDCVWYVTKLTWSRSHS